MNYRWIDTQAKFDDFVVEIIADLENEPRYAIDTEFHREKTYWPELALVQIGWAQDKIVLIDPTKVSVVGLSELFEGPFTALMHACSQDLEILQAECSSIPSKLFDTQIAAGFVGMGCPSLSKLVMECCSVTIDKSNQLTDWLKRPLSEGVCHYAASDVAHLFAVQDALEKKLKKRGRVDWAYEESETARQKDRSPPKPDVAWWKLKGRNGLRRKGQGIAQSLAGWREAMAQEENLPVRWLLSDITLLSLAKKPPRKKEDITRARGFDRRRAGKHLAAMMEAISEGMNLPDSALSLPKDRKSDDAPHSVLVLCQAWASQRADELGIEPAILGTKDDISRLIRGDASRLSHGWRAEALGNALQALAKGEAAVRVNGGRLEWVA